MHAKDQSQPSQKLAGSAAYCHAFKTPGREAVPTEGLKKTPSQCTADGPRMMLVHFAVFAKDRKFIHFTRRSVFGWQKTSCHVDRKPEDLQG